MNQELRFGIVTLPNVAWSTMLERWRYLETLGFDSVWLTDHFVNPQQPKQPWFEAWTMLAALATHTTRVRIGTLVTSIAWRNPAFLARQALTLDHLSHGRLNVGLGTGSGSGRDVSHAMAGVEDWTPTERTERFREVVEIVDRLLRTEPTTYHGRYYQANEAVMCPPPVQRPRPSFMLASQGPQTLKIVAAYADAWNTFGGYGLSPREAFDAIRRLNEQLTEYCIQIRRDPRDISRSVLAWGPVVDNPFASMDAFTDFIGRYQDIGMNEFMFYYPPYESYRLATAKQSKIFERIANELIPTLRAATREDPALNTSMP